MSGRCIAMARSAHRPNGWCADGERFWEGRMSGAQKMRPFSSERLEMHTGIVSSGYTGIDLLDRSAECIRKVHRREKVLTDCDKPKNVIKK